MTKSYRQIASDTRWFTFDPLYVDPSVGLTELFPPEKRKWSSRRNYVSYTIATIHTGKTLYSIGDIPVYTLYFILDDFGDNALPIDTAFLSPTLAMTAAETMHVIKSWKKINERFRNIGEYIGRAANSQILLPEFFAEYMRIITYLRNVDTEFESAESVVAQITAIVEKLSSRMREVGHIFKPDDF